MMTRAKTAKEIASMRQAGAMLATILEALKQEVYPGVTTKQLADVAAKQLKQLGGKAAFLGYYGFPDVLCVSINDEVVHGIPSKTKVINEGDIVSLDFGVSVDEMITDAAISVVAGATDNLKVSNLVKTTEQSMYNAIDCIRNGVKVGDIGSAVEKVLLKGQHGIVRDLVGHGVGHELHEDPNIPNYGRAGTGPMLATNMTIAVEPMATLGGHQVVLDPDGWTVRTRDGSLAAHFEHTVLITETGAEILTSI